MVTLFTKTVRCSFNPTVRARVQINQTKTISDNNRQFTSKLTLLADMTGIVSGFVELRLPYSTYVVELQVHLKHCDGFKLHIEEVSEDRERRTTNDTLTRCGF